MKYILITLIALSGCGIETIEPVFPHRAEIVNGDILRVQIVSDLDNVQISVNSGRWLNVRRHYYGCINFMDFTGGTIEVRAEEHSMKRL